MKIVQSQPTPGSVGTAALQDASVTYAKLDVTDIFGGSKVDLITASGAVTIPTNTSRAWVRMIGGGGSGGAGSATGSGGGGSAGTYAEQFLTSLTPGLTLTATIGAAGAASSTGTDGNAGGDTSLASGTQSITTITAPGGQPGKSAANGGNGGSPSANAVGAVLNLQSTQGSFGDTGTLKAEGAGMSSPLGYGFIPGPGSAGGGTSGFGAASSGVGQNSGGSAGAQGCIIIMWLP